NGFNEICQDVVGLGPLDQLRVVVSRNEDHRNGTVVVQFYGGVDAVHIGHLHVRNHEVRLEFSAMLQQFFSGSGSRNDGVSLRRKDLLKVVAHIGFVVGNGNSQIVTHGGAP